MKVLIGILVLAVILMLALLSWLFLYHEYMIDVCPSDMPGFTVAYKCWGRPSREQINKIIEAEKAELRSEMPELIRRMEELDAMMPEEHIQANKRAVERLCKEKR